ncbi:unnamed protein product [Gadus morhua 'NCC']
MQRPCNHRPGTRTAAISEYHPSINITEPPPSPGFYPFIPWLSAETVHIQTSDADGWRRGAGGEGQADGGAARHAPALRPRPGLQRAPYLSPSPTIIYRPITGPGRPPGGPASEGQRPDERFDVRKGADSIGQHM